MARIEIIYGDGGDDWSAGTELTADETWQVVEGKVWVTVESSPGDDDGLLLQAEAGKPAGVVIASGKTVKVKLADGYGYADIRHEEMA